MDLNKRRAGAYRKFSDKKPSSEIESQEQAAPRDERPASSKKLPQPSAKSPPKPSAKSPLPSAKSPQPSAKSPLPPDALIRLTRGTPDKPGRKRVAELLLLLGKEEAANVLKHLEPEAIEKVVSDIAALETVDRKEATSVLAEFGFAVQGSPGKLSGGPERAREMLAAAFGAEAAEKILVRVVPDVLPRPFEFMNDLEPQQIHTLLRSEPATVTSIVLSHIDPRIGARVLSMLEPNVQRETVRRIARLGKVDREVITRVESTLRDKIRTAGKVVSSDIDGRTVIAEILRHLSPTDGEELLNELQKDAPDLSEDIRDRLFTIDSLLLIQDQELQRVFQDFPDHDIALVLKGKSEEIRAKVLRNVSERRRTFIMDEYHRMGATPRRDVDKATKQFILLLKEMSDDGRIVVRAPDETYL
ncbi:MAG TPA: FliG C-terminal domain-containing protein [Spirochaetia bacterium]|nr:FliG C-terminal domain-containing protein [Spirochaetia bacterium]